MLWIIIALFLGIIAGTITGLTPGVHVNLVAILVVSSIGILSVYLSHLQIGVFLISMIIIHSFVDFIPSIFLGAPEGATILSVLPGHKLLLEGKGYTALKLTVIGGLGASLVGIILIPLLFLYLEKIYSVISKVIAPLLLIISIIFIATEKNKIWALLLFLLSGTLGLVILNGVNARQPLFPLLTGLFGLPVLLLSLSNENKIVEQKLKDKIKVLSRGRIISYFAGGLSSVLVSILPGVGSAQAALLSRGFSKSNQKSFLVTVGGINTAGGLFTLTVFHLIGKARTGVMVSLQQFLSLNLNTYLILIISGFIAVGLGATIALNLGKVFAKYISKINYGKVSLIIISLILTLVLALTNLIGLLILSVSTAVGLLAPKVGVKRIHLMGCLIIPVSFYFI